MTQEEKEKEKKKCDSRITFLSKRAQKKVMT
jgi:hypothetical protein